MSLIELLIMVCIGCTLVWLLAGPERSLLCKRRSFVTTLFVLAGVGGLAWLFLAARTMQSDEADVANAHVVHLSQRQEPLIGAVPLPPVPPRAPAPRIIAEGPAGTVRVVLDEDVVGKNRSRNKSVAKREENREESRQDEGRTLANARRDKRWVVQNRWFRLSEEDAYQDALDSAREQLVSAVHEVNPQTKWSISPEAVSKLVRKKDVTPREVDLGGVEGKRTVHEARLELEWTGEAQRELVRYLHQERARERLGILTQGLLAVLALMGTMLGYFRMDDWTKGYYSGWLKVGAAGTLAAAEWAVFVLPGFFS